MIAPGSPLPSVRSIDGLVLGVAIAVFFLTLLSPVGMEDSDPGLALVAAQALVQHGTLDLSVYGSDPRCSYDLSTDYRVQRRRDGTILYYSLGLPVVSAPAVWLARRLGYDMLDPSQEQALQNGLSAAVCSILFLLLFVLARREAGPWPGLIIATISTLGTSLVSTLGTGLWNTGPALVLFCLALVICGESRPNPMSRILPGLLVIGAFLVRPSMAIGGLSLIASRVASRKRVLQVLGAGAVLAVAALLLERLGYLDALPGYYRRRRVVFPDPIWSSLQGLLVSPSRGLLVFSPFLIPVFAAMVLRLRFLWPKPRFRFACYWVALLIPAVAFKAMWWGGHSYGPRLLADLIPALVLITAMIWQDGREAWSAGVARGWLTAYLVLAVLGIGIHAGQGLFNPSVRRWNEVPNIDREPDLVFDWNYPQFLSSPDRLEERRRELAERRVMPIRVMEWISFDDERVFFIDWTKPRRSRRWTAARQATIVFSLEGVDDGKTYTLEMFTGAKGQQVARFELNGFDLGSRTISGHRAQRVLLETRPAWLLEGRNELVLDLSGANSTPADPWILGLSLRRFRWVPSSPG